MRSGRHSPELIEGADYDEPADLVIKALGFEPEDLFEGVRRHHFEIIRVIETRRTVERAPGTVDGADKSALRRVLGTLKHHVLKEMCKTRFTTSFSVTTNFISYFYVNNRVAMIFVYYQNQSIRQLPFFIRNANFTWLNGVFFQ